MDVLLLEVFKVRFDEALGNLVSWEVSLFMAGRLELGNIPL